MLLGVSDHSLVYLIRKIHYTIPGCVKIISTRSFKNFNEEQFLADVELIWWNAIRPFSDPNGMWEVWKNQFLTCIDKHAPVKSKKNWEQEVPVDYVWVNMLCIKGTSLQRRQTELKISLAGLNSKQRQMKLTTHLNMPDINTSVRNLTASRND